MRRTPIKRSQPRRNWTEARAKVVEEGACRTCRAREGDVRAGEIVRLQAAHLADRSYDRRDGYFVKPERVVPLCRACHETYDGPASLRGALRMEAVVTADETEQLVADLGSLGLAWRRLTGAQMPDQETTTEG